MGLAVSILLSAISIVWKIFLTLAIKTKLWIVFVVYFGYRIISPASFIESSSPGHGNAVILGLILWAGVWILCFRKKKKQADSVQEDTYGGGNEYEKET